MQYTHKLARRLALWRGVASAAFIAGAGACDSETGGELGPLGASPESSPATQVMLADHPSQVELNEKVQLRLIAEGRSDMGRRPPMDVEWTATGGTIDATGLFSAAASGSYMVYVRGRRNKDHGDSTEIVVSPRTLVSVEISPGAALLAPAAKQVFAATGRLSDGSQVRLAAKWSASSGTIDASGVYEAPHGRGTYRVIATSRKGIADTVAVEVAGAASGATVEKILLTPASVSLEPDGTQAFTASARMSDNTSAPVEVAYRATGGTITPEGLYTADSTTGTHKVIAVAAEGKADTSAITITSAEPVVQQVVLTPATVSLAPGGTQQFSSTATMSDGSTAPAPVTYGVTGGTVTADGLYTAGQTGGSYRVVATAANGKADTSAVTITGAPATLQQIVLTPAPVFLVAGARQQFSAAGKMSDGTTTTVSVVYTATGGTIASNGLYTAGPTAGSYRVIAAQQGGALADTSAVTITVPSSNGEQAQMADSLVETISVQTHLEYGNVYTSGWSNIIRPRLLELGVRHIRQKMTGTASVHAKFRELAANGIKLTGGCWPVGTNYSDASHCIAQANALGPTVIDAFDGWNEVDGGKAGSNWPAAWVAWERTLWNAYKGHATWRTRPLYANSLAHAASADQLGNHGEILDYGNLHSYPAAQMPSATLANSWIPKWNRIAAPKPLVVTETGYHTCPTCTNGNGVSMTAQSKYTGRLLFEYFNRGIKRTNLYELIDEGLSTTDREDNWGLVKNDGTAKPAFNVVKNIISLLDDPGSAFAAGRLSYALSGALPTTHKTLLQKRDGRFYLVLWQEVRSWDLASKQDVPNPDDPVTLTLGSAASSIKVYRPSRGASPIQSGSGASINLSIPDEVIVVEVTP